jgi:hypothetical protein
LWSLSASSSDYEFSEVSSQHIQLVVEKVIVLMQYLVEPTPFFGGDAPLEHVVSQYIQPVVEKVVTSMQSSADPTLLLESVDSKKVVTLM